MAGSSRLAALLVGLASCALPTDVGTTHEAIVNGTVDTSAHDSVVRVVFPDKTACSGTLVAPNLVLTARHCVAQLDETGFSCNADNSATGTGATIHGDVDATTISIISGVDANTSTTASATGSQLVLDPSATTICHDDIAFIVLGTQTTLPYAPIAHADVTPGELVTLVGYGLTGVVPTNPEIPEKAPYQRMIRTGVAVRAVGAGPVYVDDHMGAAEFSTGEGNCNGDSGGPAFAPDGSVVGAVSHGETECLGADAMTVYTDVTKYGDLASRAFVAAGYPAAGPPEYVAPSPAKDESDSGCNSSGRSSSGGALVLLALMAVARRASRARASRTSPSGFRASRLKKRTCFGTW